MEVTINYNGQAVAVEVTLEVYESTRYRATFKPSLTSNTSSPKP